MATNDFLPFAGGAGANVLTQSAYVALSSIRSNGFSSGTANSPQLNKVWRQSSIMSAVLGQLICDSTGKDAIDDGSIGTLLDNLKTAIGAQSMGVTGTCRNVSISITSASSTGTLTASEIILESSSGLNYRIQNFNKTVNLATTGAGGMDTGAPPVNGWVALYAIYNPSTGASALLAKNATSAAQAEVYNGANMPSGFTMSALVSILPTNASGQFPICFSNDRDVATLYRSIVVQNANQSSPALVTTSAIPLNAKKAKVSINALSTAQPAILTATLSPMSNGAGQISMSGTNSVANNGWGYFADMQILTPQSVYYTCTTSAGTPTFNFGVTGFSF